MAPPRPRLSDRVAARRHVVPGASPDETVVLHRLGEAAGDGMKVGSRAWALLSAMDGSRDAVGLVSALSQRGVSVSLSDVEAFIDETSAAGIVEFGNDELPRVAQPIPPGGFDAAPRPIERMPGFSLVCDGRGSCCRFYPTITFSPLDAARARAALPLVRDGGAMEENAFTPEQGGSRRSLAVSLVDGRCAYLERGGGCGVHRVAGAGAKPFGCALYPAAFVDDGESVRVGPAVECACVVQSGVEHLVGEPLLDEAVTVASDLDPRVHVEALPASIDIAPGRVLDRKTYVALSRSLEGAPHGDVVEALSGLAKAFRGDEGVPSASTAVAHFSRGAVPERAELGRHLDTLARRVAPRARETWRSGVDLARQTFVALDAALDLARSDLEIFIAPAPRTAAAEAFYLEAVLFGHQLVTRSCHVPLTTSLVDRSARIVVARALAVVAELGGLDDPAFAQPLALVEATIRAYGLASYVLDLE